MKRHRIEMEVKENEGACFDRVKVECQSMMYEAQLPSGMMAEWLQRAVRRILEIEQGK